MLQNQRIDVQEVKDVNLVLDVLEAEFSLYYSILRKND